MTKVALLIWVSSYKPDTTTPSPIATDLAAMAKVLQQEKLGGFDRVDVLIDPDRQAMEEAIEERFRGMGINDLGLLIFSGHCVIDRHVNLYLSNRITRKNEQGGLVKSTAVNASFIKEVLDSGRSHRQIIVLDGYLSGAAESLPYASDTVDYQHQLGGTGRVILTALTLGHSLFNPEPCLPSAYIHYLMQGLATGAADWDRDGQVVIAEWHRYAKKRSQAVDPAISPELFGENGATQIVIAHAPTADPGLIYRQEVEYREQNGQISASERAALTVIQQGLDLSAETVTQIEAEVFQPYQNYRAKLAKYEQTLVDYCRQTYPLSSSHTAELRWLRQSLRLRPDDIIPIEKRVKADVEDYQSKLRQYEQTFATVIHREYPMGDGARTGLASLQQILGLRDEDVRKLEARLLAQYLSQPPHHIYPPNTDPATPVSPSQQNPAMAHRSPAIAEPTAPSQATPSSSQSETTITPSQVQPNDVTGPPPEQEVAETLILGTDAAQPNPTADGSSSQAEPLAATASLDSDAKPLGANPLGHPVGSPSVVFHQPMAGSPWNLSNGPNLIPVYLPANYTAASPAGGAGASPPPQGAMPDVQATAPPSTAGKLREEQPPVTPGGTQLVSPESQPTQPVKGKEKEMSPVVKGILFAVGLTCFVFVAIAVYNIAMLLSRSSQPVDPRVLLEQAAERRRQKDYTGAISDYTKIIDQKVSSTETAVAYYQRGNVQYDKGDRQAAIADYTQAIALNPNDASSYNNRGVAYHEVNQLDAAITDYSAAIQLQPTYANAYRNRAFAYRSLGRRPEAIADFQQAARLYAQQGNAQDQQEALAQANQVRQGR